MKKTKNTIKKTVKTSKTSKITKRSIAHHVVKSLVSVAPHAHTGRSIHRRHTSHGVLLLALLLTGVLLFSNLGAFHAYGLSSEGSQTISVNVTGHPPTKGADITYPTTNTVTKSPQIQVTGTCEAETLVATYNNGTFAGSSMCTDDETFATVIQLVVGVNVLQSQNYDAANQAGPATPQVTITRDQEPAVVSQTTPTSPEVPTVATTTKDITPDTTPPVVAPAPQPEANPCFDTAKSDNLDPAVPTIIANCIIRSISIGQKVSLPIQVTGGTTPYTLHIDWGDGSSDVKHVGDTNFHLYQHVYNVAGIVNVKLKTTDANGVTSFLQTVVQVNGSATSAGSSTSPLASFTAGISNVWTKAPVPLYWAAVMLVVGFWVGDIFERIFDKGAKGNQGKRGKKQPTRLQRHRHA